jgi:hypothetical protein
MYLANLSPDWNSLDSVRLAHSRLELSSIVFFGLLVVAEAIAHKLDEGKAKHRTDTVGIVFFVIAVLCEAAAYPYGQRNDELSEYVIRSLSATAGHAATNAHNALTDSGTALTKAEKAVTASEKANDSAESARRTITAIGGQANEIDQRLNMAQFFLSDRLVLDSEGLKKKLAVYKGRPIFFRSYVNDGDGYFLCKELDWIAGSAGIIPTDQCGLFPVEPPHPMTQINVFAPDDDTMLSLSSVMAGATAYGSSTGPAGNAPHSPAIIVFVGRKNRVVVGETAQTRDAERRAAAMKKNTKARP